MSCPLSGLPLPLDVAPQASGDAQHGQVSVRILFPSHLLLLASGLDLQASGEALYTSDVTIGGSELFAVLVPSTQALAHLVGVDPAPALQLPGVVAFVGPDDIPAGGSNLYVAGSASNTVGCLSGALRHLQRARYRMHVRG